MILGFHHVGMATPDLNQLVGFYTNLFGGQILKEFSWGDGDTALSQRLGLQISSGRLAMIGFEGARIEVFEFVEPKIALEQGLRSVAKPGLSHICFRVDDCQTEYDRLNCAGMSFHSLPLVMPSGGVFAYGRDPDGNVVEILQPPVKPG